MLVFLLVTIISNLRAYTAIFLSYYEAISMGSKCLIMVFLRERVAMYFISNIDSKCNFADSDM